MGDLRSSLRGSCSSQQPRFGAVSHPISGNLSLRGAYKEWEARYLSRVVWL
jgi:hypothetical protein